MERTPVAVLAPLTAALYLPPGEKTNSAVVSPAVVNVPAVRPSAMAASVGELSAAFLTVSPYIAGRRPRVYFMLVPNQVSLLLHVPESASNCGS